MAERLIKYCEKQHNPVLSGLNVKLGTFEYYRRLEATSPIADAGEATHKVNIPEGVEFTLDQQQVANFLGDNVTITGGSLTLATQPGGGYFEVIIGNAYMLCVSQCTSENPPSVAQASSIAPAYDSMWEITDREGFTKAVGEALLETLTLKHLSPAVVKQREDWPLKDLTLKIFHFAGPVEYVDDREHTIVDANSANALPPYQDMLKRAMFRKLTKDAHQREFRFVFCVGDHKDRLISVKPEPIYIPATRLQGVLAKVIED
jgi:hypothetical protein